MPHRDDDIVVLTSAASEIQAALWVSVLESHGIPAMAPGGAATTLRWEVAGTDPYKVYVRRGDAQRAREALARERADSVDIDWSEVDTGDPEPEGAGDDRRGTSVVMWVMCLVITAMLLAAMVWSMVGG